MTEINCFKDVVNLWPSREALAEDIRAGGHSNITNVHIQSWANRDNVPAVYWLALIKGANEREFGDIGYPLLASLAQSKTLISAE